MRIAHVITRMIVGGAQENTLFTCQDLIRLYGDEVRLITGLETGPEGDLLGQGRGGEVPVLRVSELHRAIRPWSDYQAYHALKIVLREFRPDVVHTHSAKGGFLGRLAAWNLQGPAVIHTVHGAPFHSYQNILVREFFRRCESFAARHCHAFVSVADAMTDLMVNAGVASRDSFETVYSGMDVEPFLHANDRRDAIRARFGFKSDQVVIGKIARLFHLKGHEYLLAAAPKIVRECPQVQFLLIGDGILRERFNSQITAAGLQDHFHFTGLVPPEEIPPLIGAMDALVHVSLREGLARALPQALIAGKPVVSYDIDGAREVVLPDETGFLLPPQSVEPLAAAIIQLARNPDLRTRLGQHGRQRFTDQFRHETMTRKIRTIYERVIGQ
jgi:glycosyltransferase involved in cell wall biosynthesis